MRFNHQKLLEEVEKRALSQKAFAELVGISLPAASLIMRGATISPQLTTLRKIARAFGLGITDLLKEVDY